MPIDTDPHCGCALPPGVWGNHGFHHMLMDAAYLLDKERRAFYAERQSWNVAEKKEAWEKWLQQEQQEGRLKNGLHENHRTYVGQPVALEPCPAYMAAVARNQQSETKRKKGGRRKLLGDEEPALPYPND